MILCPHSAACPSRRNAMPSQRLAIHVKRQACRLLKYTEVNYHLTSSPIFNSPKKKRLRRQSSPLRAYTLINPVSSKTHSQKCLITISTGSDLDLGNTHIRTRGCDSSPINRHLESMPIYKSCEASATS